LQKVTKITNNIISVHKLRKVTKITNNYIIHIDKVMLKYYFPPYAEIAYLIKGKDLVETA
jgi:hypothetical protein